MTEKNKGKAKVNGFEFKISSSVAWHCTQAVQVQYIQILFPDLLQVRSMSCHFALLPWLLLHGFQILINLNYFQHLATWCFATKCGATLSTHLFPFSGIHSSSKMYVKIAVLVYFLSCLHRNLHTNGIDDLLLFIASSPDEVC